MILSFYGLGADLVPVNVTPAQIRARLQAEVVRIAGVIAKQKSELAAQDSWYNRLLETQRDALARAKDAVAQNERILQQLKDTLEDAVAGGPDKLQRWLDLAKIIGDVSDLQVWKNNLQYTSTANMVSTVTKDSLTDIKEGVEKAASFGLNAALIFVGMGVITYSIARARR